MICDVLKLDYATTKQCILSAYLHDVGKIKVPSEILQKEGSLTDEEYEIMKKHTVYGYEIVMQYAQFSYLAPIVRGHHENLDGSGYPDGLKDEQISEETKLIKIADIYDALTQRRQYKDKLLASEAVDLILDDIRKNKTGAKYLHFLLIAVVEKLEEKYEGDFVALRKAKEDLETLEELDAIYKKIYDHGVKPEYTNKLNKYELSPGYDMSTNTSLLSRTKTKIENLQRIVDEEKSEIKKLSNQCKEAKKLVKKGEWETVLFGKRV